MSNVSSTNGGTVLTIPASSIWQGCVTISAVAVTGIGSSGVVSSPTVTISGTASNWNNGDTVAATIVGTSTSAVTALNGTQDSNTTISTGLTIQTTAAGSVTLVLNFTGTGVSAIANASGVFI